MHGHFITQLHCVYLKIVLNFALIRREIITNMVAGLDDASVSRVLCCPGKRRHVSSFLSLLYKSNSSWYLSSTLVKGASFEPFIGTCFCRCP